MRISNTKFVKYLWRLLSISLLLLLWQAVIILKLTNTNVLPSPITVFNSLISALSEGEIITDVYTSLWRVLIGFAIAALLGIPLGYFSAIHKKVEYLTSPIIEILRPIPPIAFVGMAILWFGIGNGPAFFIVSFGAFFPIFTNTYHGFKSINPIFKDAAQSLGAKKRLLISDILLPAALPSIFIGLKTGLGIAWFCVIAAELVGAQSGLGYKIQLNRLTLQSDKVIVGMIMFGIIGYLMSFGMTTLQRKLTPWSKG